MKYLQFVSFEGVNHTKIKTKLKKKAKSFFEMKTIFTRANKSLQNNPQTPSYTLELKQSNSNNEPTRADDNSILNRIKLNKKGPQKPKAITVTKGEDFNAHAFDIARIQKKTIQKDISKRLNRPHISDYEEELKVDEDSNQEQINQGKGHFTVSLKNLSSKVTDQDLKDILSNETYIIGSRVNYCFSLKMNIM